ncbi:MAG: TetR/AcrR family transcriptional regulator [Desulfuromonadales bacterium]|nr:TetR/AcrR family transcriptional regulator [Desulfuromonadales bacterium]
MTGVREQKKLQTRKAIIDAAIKLFTEKGFEQTSMDELAREAGVGKGTIYGYFKAKGEIFLAYCEAEIDFAFAALDRKIDEEAPLVDQLIAQIMGQITFVTRNREFGRIFIREMSFPGENTQLSCRDLDNRYIDKLAEVLSRAQKRGELPEESDLLLLIGHFHALYMLVISSLYNGNVSNIENAEIFLRSLILQTLHGPAALALAPEKERGEWRQLKQQFIEQHELKL